MVPYIRGTQAFCGTLYSLHPVAGPLLACYPFHKHLIEILNRIVPFTIDRVRDRLGRAAFLLTSTVTSYLPPILLFLLRWKWCVQPGNLHWEPALLHHFYLLARKQRNGRETGNTHCFLHHSAVPNSDSKLASSTDRCVGLGDEFDRATLVE
jgi:hypothetical protein